MGKIAQIQYLGELRTENKHLRSGDTFITDAPTDNNGKGEAFSPTDLLATALGNCMLTVMGIKARTEGFDLEEASVEVGKEMQPNPRRVSAIHLKVRLRANCGDQMRKTLEETAKNCPVAKSLHPEVKQEVVFEWS